jgi:hypothetical protein
VLPFKTDEPEARLHVTRKGIRIAYYCQGVGEPVVLIRGYGNAASMVLAGTACKADRGLTTDPEVLALFATLPDLSDMEAPGACNADLLRFIHEAPAFLP